ncbi:hypothetical protein Hypma_011489 [Hypsizygus marmoreus]|uniref:Uncharacterized protein n=1 Tax=Hypsizygus marmoreus TaxID=39966 RepID=A0A369JI59_HYPMA|nr:hypothetical protein Hypma_011489 [Hypsizygus marmoreus]
MVPSIIRFSPAPSSDGSSIFRCSFHASLSQPMHTTCLEATTKTFMAVKENDPACHHNLSPFSSTPPLPSALPIVVQLESPGNVTACSAMTFFWSHTSDSVIVNLSIMPWKESSTLPSPSQLTTPLLITLAVNIPSNIQNFTWDAVDVAEGWYVIHLVTTTTMVSTESAPFFVKNGANITCLRYRHSSSTSQSHQGTSAAHHAMPHPLRPADLISIVLGAVVGICILTGAFLFPRLWRRSLPSPKKRWPSIAH